VACNITTIKTQACASGIGKVRDPIQLLQLIAQLTCEASEGGGSGNYATYRAIVNQEAGLDPVATVLENSLEGTPVWTRTGEGAYDMTLAGAFAAAKTWVNLAAFSFYPAAFTDNRIQFKRLSDDVIRMTIPNEGLPPDGTMVNAMVEVLVYP
jgi:hypothetical protein